MLPEKFSRPLAKYGCYTAYLQADRWRALASQSNTGSVFTTLSRALIVCHQRAMVGWAAIISAPSGVLVA